MVGPVIVFSQWRPHDSGAAITRWNRFAADIQHVSRAIRDGATPPVQSPASAVDDPGDEGVACFWRLVAPNNREMARSFRRYSSFSHARQHVARVLAEIDGLDIVPFVGGGAGTHGWYATMGDQPVMTCSRWYSGRTSSVGAAHGAVGALREAVIEESPRATARPGRAATRRLRP